jgi:hypothetical protein
MKQLDKWHKTKIGYLVFALVELVLAYAFVSLSIDKGNFWYYGLTLVFLVGVLRNLFGLLGAFTRKRR